MPNNREFKESRCIICGKEKDGIEIEEDYIFKTYRYIVHKWRDIIGKSELNKRNYRLVVCKECYPTYYKARSAYVRKEYIYVGLGLLFTIVLALFSSSKLMVIVYGLLLTILLYLMAQLSYVPALKIPASLSKPAANSLKPKNSNPKASKLYKKSI
ncbi:MAG: hypothetical protein ACP5RP_00955 [Candidatus Micrarchaeia archaeon]